MKERLKWGALAATLFASTIAGCGGGSTQTSAGIAGHSGVGGGAAGASGRGGQGGSSAGAAGSQAGGSSGGGPTDAGSEDAAGSSDAGDGPAPHVPGAPGTWAPVRRTAVWPPADSFDVLIHDSARNVLLLLGAGYQPEDPLDTWEFDLATSTWTNRLPSPAPARAAWPRNRSAFAAAYDSQRGRTLIFGGSNFYYYDELWEWDGSTGAWTALTPNPRPASWPVFRFGVAGAYDSDRGKFVIFAGQGRSATTPDYVLYNELWEWDAGTSTWTNRTPDPLPANWPGARDGHGMVYDRDRKRAVVFGGDATTTADLRLADLWEWDGAAGSWRDLTPPNLSAAVWPPARMFPATTYIPSRSSLLVAAGSEIDVAFDVWEWSAATSAWTDRTASPMPTDGWFSARSGSGCVFVPALNRAFLYGGSGFTGNGRGKLDDFWTWQPPDPGT